MELVDILRMADTPIVLLVMAWQLRWSVQRMEEKDRLIADIALRSAAAMQAALERQKQS